MSANTPAFEDVFRLDASSGRISLGGRRHILLDAAAVGQMRLELAEALGWEAARSILERIGYNCGRSDALQLKKSGSLLSDEEWLDAGIRLHSLQGMANARLDCLQIGRAEGKLLVSGEWLESFEAEQSLQWHGPRINSGCWTLEGYVSGYATELMGSDAICIETRCRARGDPSCLFELRPAAEWGTAALPVLEMLKSTQPPERFDRCLRAIGEKCCELEQASPDAVITTDVKGIITSCSPAAGEIMDILTAEAIGRQAGYFCRGGNSEFQSIIDRLHRQKRIRSYLTEIITPAGRRTPVALSASAIRNRVGLFAGIIVVAHDLSSFFNLEKQLAQTEHLATMGELSAGLAHEIKNPLAGIKGAIDVIRDSLPPEHVHREVLGDVLHQVGRIDGIVRDLLNYAKPKEPTLSPVRLPSLVQHIVGIAGSGQKPGAAPIEVKQLAPIPDFTGDETQLEQALMNLLLNAQSAVQPQGRVEVTLDFDAGTGSIRIEVKDDGPGIPEEVQKKIFQPFFTTRTDGTGLGLAICARNIQYHGGTIGLDSAPGRGTSFLVTIPLYCRI